LKALGGVDAADAELAALQQLDPAGPELRLLDQEPAVGPALAARLEPLQVLGPAAPDRAAGGLGQVVDPHLQAVRGETVDVVRRGPGDRRLRLAGEPGLDRNRRQGQQAAALFGVL